MLKYAITILVLYLISFFIVNVTIAFLYYRICHIAKEKGINTFTWFVMNVKIWQHFYLRMTNRKFALIRQFLPIIKNNSSLIKRFLFMEYVLYWHVIVFFLAIVVIYLFVFGAFLITAIMKAL